jgi:hypothetical protein
MTTEQDPLRSLIEKWRAEAAEALDGVPEAEARQSLIWATQLRYEHETLTRCADELEALLASPVVSQNEKEKDV